MTRLSSLRRVAVGLVLVAIAASQAVAQPPDILRNFRFIPSRSTVHVTGGFAGVDWDLHIAGKYGLVTGYRQDPESPLPVLSPYAQFVDVDAYLFNPLSFAPIPTPGWDLDKTLNLSGLRGTFPWDDPNRFVFQGEDGQGQPITLRAKIRGRLMRIVGANDPLNAADGSVCADCFGYRIDALAHLAPYADFNLDGVIDNSDVQVLLANSGMTAGAAFEQGDADGDGDVDGDDILAWSRQVGTAVDLSEFGDAGLGSVAIPEPASLALLVLASVMLAVSFRRRLFHL
jgi:hypothetical protein